MGCGGRASRRRGGGGLVVEVDFELYPLWDWESMEFLEASMDEQTRSRVLEVLECMANDGFSSTSTVKRLVV